MRLLVPAVFGLSVAACSPTSFEKPKAPESHQLAETNRGAIGKPAEADLQKLRNSLHTKVLVALTKFSSLDESYLLRKNGEGFFGYRYCHDSGKNTVAEITAVENRRDGYKGAYPSDVDFSTCDQLYSESSDRQEKAKCYTTATIANLYYRDPAQLFATIERWNNELSISMQCMDTAQDQPDFPAVKADVEQHHKFLMDNFPTFIPPETEEPKE